MGRKQNQLVSSGDKWLRKSMNLTMRWTTWSNCFVIGEHHLDTPSLRPASLKELTDNLAKVRASLTNGGAVVAREDLGLEAAWWAQLGQFFVTGSALRRDQLEEFRSIVTVPFLSDRTEGRQ